MHPRKLFTFLIALFFLSSVLTNSVYAGPPEPEKGSQPAPPLLELSLTAPQSTQSGIQSVVGSTLQSITPIEFPIGTAIDLCFGFFLQSPDYEYGDHVDVDLPNNWTVNSVAADSVPAANGYEISRPPVSDVNEGNVVYWQSKKYPPQTTFGAWLSGSTGKLFYFCANVTIPDLSGHPWSLPWTYVGDGWGGGPHSISGTYVLIGPTSPLSLVPSEIHTVGCPYKSQTFTLSTINSTSDSMTVNLSYAVTSGSGSCSGPASVVIPALHGFPVDISIEATNALEQTFVCNITAVDAEVPANTDTSQLIYDAEVCFFDPAGWKFEPITGATPNQISAGLVGSNPAATGPVGYVIGGYGAGSDVLNPDLQMFDPQTRTWTQLADLLNPRFSPVAGWIEGRLYVVGGYDLANNATNDLQVFDPVKGTWDNTAPPDMPDSLGGGAGGIGTCSSGSGVCLFHVGGGPNITFASLTLDTFEFDPGTNKWSRLDPKPAGYSIDGHLFGAGVGCGGKIYVGGDYRGYHHFFGLDATQTAGSQWTQLANFPAAAGAMTPALVCDDASQMIYLIGGNPDGGWMGFSNTVFVYDMAADTWSGPLVQTLNVGQTGSVGWFMLDKLWSVGGANNSGAISPMPFESLTRITCEIPQFIYLPLITR